MPRMACSLTRTCERTSVGACLAPGVLPAQEVRTVADDALPGVCAGTGTATPALAAIQEAAKSPVPTLGYGVSYAVGNVLLALWGWRCGAR